MGESELRTFDEFLTTSKAGSAFALLPQPTKWLCRLGKLNAETLNACWVIFKTEIDSFASAYSETRGRPPERVEHRKVDAL